MTPKELREKRAKLAAEIRKLADKANNENRDFNSEEKGNWEQVNKDYDQLSAQIDRAERAIKVDEEQRALPGRGDFDGREGGEAKDDDMTDAELGIAERSVKPAIFGCALQGWMRARSGMDVESGT
jgi:HK97 family phage major capsid protein